MRALLLHLEGPLQSYGTEAVDSRRPVAEMPGRSMLVGLVANALGYRRTEPDRHEVLQRRVTYAARLDRSGSRVRDFQTAQLGAGDVAWTTWGVPQGRDGGPKTYETPHIRYMDYHADRVCVVALSLADGEGPTLDEVAEALRRPARPIFLGRKTCLPSAPVLAGIREGADVVEVLMREPLRADCDTEHVLVQADGVHAEHGWRRLDVTDSRAWRSGFFGGSRAVSQAYVPSAAFPEAA